MKKIFAWLVALLPLLFGLQSTASAQPVKPLERVRLTVPAKSLTFIPYYFGKAQGFYAREGIELEIIVMRPPLGVTALVAGELDYSAAGGLSVRAAMKGVAATHGRFYPDAFEFQSDRPARHDAGADQKRFGERHRFAGSLRGADGDEAAWQRKGRLRVDQHDGE